mmetsp:Transcript_9321/g.24852  ORF Transcript_9321/g.24852 Transcript_9321/m.24852 type:complete len:84 (+) Transcript_9321:843-1094(+)
MVSAPTVRTSGDGHIWEPKQLEGAFRKPGSMHCGVQIADDRNGAHQLARHKSSQSYQGDLIVEIQTWVGVDDDWAWLELFEVG